MQKNEIDKGIVEAIKPLAETPEDVDKLNSGDANTIKAFAETKRHNKKIFLTLLKQMISEAKADKTQKIKTPLLGGELGLLFIYKPHFFKKSDFSNRFLFFKS